MPTSDSKGTGSDSCGMRYGLWRLYALLLAGRQQIHAGLVARAVLQAGMKVAPSTILLTLDQMTKRGLLQREPATNPTTARPMRITPAGHEALRRVRPAVEGILTLMDEVLGRAPKAQDRVAAPPGPTRRSRNDVDIDGLALILDAVRTSERERVQLRDAIDQIQAVVADALA
ncbi:MAG: hypothetical protein WAT39_00430 [Planctomycetota bacterium]